MDLPHSARRFFRTVGARPPAMMGPPNFTCAVSWGDLEHNQLRVTRSLHIIWSKKSERVPAPPRRGIFYILKHTFCRGVCNRNFITFHIPWTHGVGFTLIDLRSFPRICKNKSGIKKKRYINDWPSGGEQALETTIRFRIWIEVLTDQSPARVSTSPGIHNPFLWVASKI